TRAETHRDQAARPLAVPGDVPPLANREISTCRLPPSACVGSGFLPVNPIVIRPAVAWPACCDTEVDRQGAPRSRCPACAQSTPRRTMSEHHDGCCDHSHAEEHSITPEEAQVDAARRQFVWGSLAAGGAAVSAATLSIPYVSTAQPHGLDPV